MTDERLAELSNGFHERSLAGMCYCYELLDSLKVERAEVERLEEAAAYACAEFDENWKAGRMSIDAKTAHDALAKLIADTQEKGE